MVTIRCTKKLMRRLRGANESRTTPSTSTGVNRLRGLGKLDAGADDSRLGRGKLLDADENYFLALGDSFSRQLEIRLVKLPVVLRQENHDGSIRNLIDDIGVIDHIFVELHPFLVIAL